MPMPSPSPTQTGAWWRAATAYQIYPRSFCDSDGDGIGDIPGIISRLDHLRDLGIGFIWLSPVYASPMVDNGYDISDYRAIAPDFGTLADFDALVAEARVRGIGIVMDLVVNHSSSEHAWFRAARTSRSVPEHEFYVWRDGSADGGPPDGLQSYFGGPAWHFVPEVGQWYLHLFAKEQPDLNWDNPALRAEIYAMMNWWLDRGVAGFRMDVIDLIGKDVDRGLIAAGPHLHERLREMHREVLAGRDVVTVGETWSVTPETGQLYCGRDRGELSMVFQFDHVKEGWDPEHGKWRPRPFDLVAFKKTFFDWQAALAEDGWNSLFLGNHDLPRQVSRYGDDGLHRVASAKMLATVLHLMKGTPYVYQGEEIGMTNIAFSRLDQFRDVETFGQHAEAIARGMPEAEFLAGANANGRDNARTPMQWTAGPGAGFTTGTPWIEVNPNHRTISVAAERADPDGILAHYTRLIALRRALPIIVEGRFIPFAEEDRAVFAYARELGGARLSVVANFTGTEVAFDVPEGLEVTGRALVASHAARGGLGGRIILAPYESFAVLGDTGGAGG